MQALTNRRNENSCKNNRFRRWRASCCSD